MRLEEPVISIISAERPAAAKAVSNRRHADLASNVSSASSELSEASYLSTLSQKRPFQ